MKINRNIEIKLSKNAREGMYIAIRTKKMFVNYLDLLIERLEKSPKVVLIYVAGYFEIALR